MAPSSAASLFLACLLLLLLPASHGAYSHGGNWKLPVVHRQSPCSPLHGLPSLTAADVLRRDTSHIRRRFTSQSSRVAAPASAATIIPVNGSSDSSTLPGELDYIVLVGLGTPEQQFPMFLDTSVGTSLIRGMPCASVDNCDPAFDTSRSSNFTHVLCASPDCGPGGSVCPFDNPNIAIDGTFAKDVLKPTPSLYIHNFTFVCMDVGPPGDDLPEAGFLDLSRDRNSLPSRLSLPSYAGFSYCLPQSPSSQGFLSLGDDATVRDDDNRTVHAPLVSNDDPELAILYFIDVVAMSLGGEDIPIPAGTFGSNASTILDVGTTFTMLVPDVYTPLRDAFRKEMSRYNDRSVPEFAGFDTCFNFTGLQELTIPLAKFKFGNGESLLVHRDQMLYYDDPTAAPFTMACLAFSAFDDSGVVVSAVIGTYTLASMEVVYDVAGGKVGFIRQSC